MAQHAAQPAAAREGAFTRDAKAACMKINSGINCIHNDMQAQQSSHMSDADVRFTVCSTPAVAVRCC